MPHEESDIPYDPITPCHAKLSSPLPVPSYLMTIAQPIFQVRISISIQYYSLCQTVLIIYGLRGATGAIAGLVL